MDLIDKILQEKYYYTQQTGKEPRYLVLDQERYLKVKQSLYPQTNIHLEKQTDEKELFGLVLIVTKAKNLEVLA